MIFRLLQSARRFIVAATLSLSVASAVDAGPAATEPRVGPKADGVIAPNAQLIRPAGTTVAYPGRPFDLALSPDGSIAFIKNATGITVLDAQKWTILEQAPTTTTMAQCMAS